MSGIELMKVRDVLGHSSVRQTEERYAYLHPDALWITSFPHEMVTLPLT
ncbi:hypothetical protein HCU01_11780 [Halomonas cupida]|uniref:Phage integrase family protein n=1 Tax=Halomonas cupida TaxID=44933 RepID=A0A1M7ERZ4_9GAMM|nr:hypothetical protein HCU01_11780 [Halomonas cupida]SHL94373.1 hypothetical protein SAMN05660971_01759 [Halomonas cupida]